MAEHRSDSDDFIRRMREQLNTPPEQPPVPPIEQVSAPPPVQTPSPARRARFCPECGGQMALEAKFCQECGWSRPSIDAPLASPVERKPDHTRALRALLVLFAGGGLIALAMLLGKSGTGGLSSCTEADRAYVAKMPDINNRAMQAETGAGRLLNSPNPTSSFWRQQFNAQAQALHQARLEAEAIQAPARFAPSHEKYLSSLRRVDSGVDLMNQGVMASDTSVTQSGLDQINAATVDAKEASRLLALETC